MRELRHIPELGDIVVNQDYSFTVTAVKGRRAERVRIEVMESGNNSDSKTAQSRNETPED